MEVIARDVDAETHGADHHRQSQDLDRGVDEGDDANAAAEGEVQGYCAEGEEDDEDDGHHAGVGVAFADVDAVGVFEAEVACGVNGVWGAGRVGGVEGG